ncbi:MAG TPA: hypothetical protein VLI04_06430 [Nocardioidaceae bacterium]|nr:hypothetical protein [Nocardioidaceae bacterium]
MFIQIIQAKCTRQDEAKALVDRWIEEMGPHAIGWLGGTYGFTDDDMFVGVVRFESREKAMENSQHPRQGEWWAEMEKCLDGPAEFHDCDDVTLMLNGGSDDAGFVQMIRGKVDDADTLRAMMTDTEALHEMRPDILGGLLAIEDDGTFTETVFFTSEEDARRYEVEAPMPAEMQQQMEMAMHDVSYIDLHRPWFSSKK